MYPSREVRKAINWRMSRGPVHLAVTVLGHQDWENRGRTIGQSRALQTALFIGFRKLLQTKLSGKRLISDRLETISVSCYVVNLSGWLRRVDLGDGPSLVPA